jgi:hypothetical protein
MKKKVFYLVCFVGLAWAMNSCDAISKTCKNCKIVRYDASGAKISEDSPTQYCGAELVGIQAQTPQTVGGVTAKWECN